MPPPADALGAFEIWYSDVSAFFGTRARTVLQGTGQLGAEHHYRIERDARGDDATGRYVSLRLFDPHKRLRLDWMRVHGTDPAPVADAGRRLFGVAGVAGAELDDELAAQDASRDAPKLVRGVGEEAAQDEGRDDPEPGARERDESLPYADERGWWHAIERRHRPNDGWLYARRAPPGAHGTSAAGSLGLAVALAEARETTVPIAYHGQAVTMDAMCAWLSTTRGCTRGDHWSLLYNREVGLLPDEPTATDDDADWATQLLSAAIEPVVYVLVEDSLRCAACSEDDWGVDGLICASCDPTLRGHSDNSGNSDYERALRLVEAKLGGGGSGRSRAVPDCVSSPDCLREVATEAALDLGAATAMPPSTRLDALAEANQLLLAGAVVDFSGTDANGRDALLRAHRTEVARLVGPPHELPQWTRVLPAGYGANGRRLAEQEDHGDAKDAAPPLTPTEYAMRLQTNHTCYMIQVAENRSAALESHAIATQLWLTMDGGGNGPKNRGNVCVDCQFPNTTHACRAHFALVGRLLTRMRAEEELAAKRAAEEEAAASAHAEGGARRRRELEEHVRQRVGESCCARMPPDGHEECGPRFCEVHARNVARKRAATAVRRLHEAKHPVVDQMGGVGLQVGIDTIAPELHPDPACRDAALRHPRNLTGPTAAECLGRSALHHLSEAHGLSADALRSKIEGMGLEMGTTLTGVARALGVLRERRSAGGPAARSAHDRQRAHDGRQADALLAESRRRSAEVKKSQRFGRKLAEQDAADRNNETEEKYDEDDEALLWMSHPIDRGRRRLGRNGRKLAERHYEGRDLGHHAAQAGVVHRHMHRSHRILHAGLRRLDLQATRATNRHLRAARRHGQPHPSATPDALNSLHDLRGRTMPPLTALLALQAEEGSLASRFGGAVASLGALRERATVAWDAVAVRSTTAKLDRRHRRRRALAERPVDPHKIYDYLESRQAERLNSRPQRQLHEGLLPPEAAPRILELPESHALSWVHNLVGDWDSVFDEATRLRDVVTRRLEARRAGVAHAEAVRRHPTGVEWLDSARHTQPSAVGEAMRRLWHRVAHDGADPPWHERTAGRRVARRLDDARHGRLRRLGEAFLEGTVAAPFAFVDTVLPSGTIVRASRVGFWEATLRYLLSSTIGCYFVKPVEQRSDTQGDGGGDAGLGDDGDAIKVLRPSAEKLCFPAARSLALEPRLFLVAHRPIPTCTTAPARSFHSSCPSCAPFARSPTPRTSTSSRSPTSVGARATASSRPRRARSTRSATTRAPKTRFCPTRRFCARPKRSTPCSTRRVRAPRPSRPPRVLGSSCAASRSSAACCTCSSCSSSRSCSSRSCPWSILPFSSALTRPPPGSPSRAAGPRSRPRRPAVAVRPPSRAASPPVPPRSRGACDDAPSTNAKRAPARPPATTTATRSTAACSLRRRPMCAPRRGPRDTAPRPSACTLSTPRAFEMSPYPRVRLTALTTIRLVATVVDASVTVWLYAP